MFHTSQIDRVPANKAPAIKQARGTRPKASETILKNTQSVIRTGGDRAFYSPATDHIQLLPDHAFNGPAEYAALALLELAHRTGHSSRLNRGLENRFGSSAYAMGKF